MADVTLISALQTGSSDSPSEAVRTVRYVLCILYYVYHKIHTYIDTYQVHSECTQNCTVRQVL